MKRFKFKFEKLLEVRAFHERRAELILAEKAARCGELESELRTVAENRQRTTQEMFAVGRGLEDFRSSGFYLMRLDRERDRLFEELALAEAEREEARREYLKKRVERESIDKLRERRQAEYYRLAEREEMKIIDDLVSSRVAASRG
ncbi:MAG: flagellar export protein FliJ [Treponema sp.]|nr:flagellar export protein FliJ [Treponema sp.]